MARDRVNPIKWERPSQGGTEYDDVPTELDHAEDYVNARGMAFQDATSNDEAVVVERDGAGNLSFFDAIVTAPKTLTDLLDDKKVKVDADDTTSDYLYPKLQAGANITLTKVDVGSGVKAVKIDSSASLFTIPRRDTHYDTPITTEEYLYILNANKNIYEVNSKGTFNMTVPNGPELSTEDAHGLLLSYQSANVIRIGPGMCRSDDDQSNIINPTDIDLTVTNQGAGGLDVGSVGSGMYYVWLIYDPVTHKASGVFSLSATNPAMPGYLLYSWLPYYTKKRLIGAVPYVTNTFLNFRMTGFGRLRRIEYNEDSNTYLRKLNAGSSTSWATVDCTSLAPAVLTSSLIVYATTASQTGYVRCNGHTGSDSGQLVATSGTSVYGELPATDRIIQYKATSGGTVSIWIFGYWMDIGSKAPQLPVHLPVGYTDGLNMVWVSDSTLQIGIGRCRSDDDTTNLVLTATVNAVLSSSGAGGLDTGAEANSTWYYLWLIYNPSTLTYAAMFSLSSTSPTMPSGYTKKRFIGQDYNDSSGNLHKFVSVNSAGTERYVVYDEERTTTLRALSAGTQNTWTDISLAALVPPNATTVVVFLSSSTASAGLIRPDTSANSSGVFIRSSTDWGSFELPMVGTQIIEYQAAASSNLTVDVIGYRYQCDVPVSANTIESPPEYLQDCRLSWQSVSTVRINTGRARSDCNCMDMVPPATIDVVLSASGAGGLDTGSEASDKVYYVWLIYNPTTVTYSGVFSLSGISPTFPAGYVAKRCLGAVYNNSSSNIFKFFMVGTTNHRFVYYDEDRATWLRALAGGTSTSWADVDSSDWIPLGVTDKLVMCQSTGGTSAGVRPDDLSDHDGYTFAVDKSKCVFLPGQRFFEYITSGLFGGQLTVDIMGYRIVL